MILSIREYVQADFRGFNFLLSTMSPQIVQRQSAAASSSFLEAILAAHGNDEATLPFPSFDQESCELKVAKFRAEKKIKDRLLPPPRYYCISHFTALKRVYSFLPSWMKVYIFLSTGEAVPLSTLECTGKEEGGWSAHQLPDKSQAMGISLFEDAESGIENWTRTQRVPRGGSIMRLSQYVETPRLGDPGRAYMPIWTMGFGS